MKELYHELRKEEFPKAVRTLVQMIYTSKKNIREIAAILSISRNTVRKH
ncbi:hypothetical protein [Thermotomaculum hydrothermale]|nr:hypothetical protein [Thermotomaculum hydrothermale]